MSFTLRQVTHRVAGGDIVRSRNIASEAPRIGRGADCDIQLPDLAVGLHHAVLRETAAGRVAVEGIGKLTFEVNGAFVSRAELVVADMPQLGFGSHMLTLAPGKQPGEIVVTAAHEEGTIEGMAAADRNIFILTTSLFGRRRTAWTTALAILALCLAWPVWQFYSAYGQERTITAATRSDKQWSSGPLLAGHRFLETNCQACHRQAFVAVRDTACTDCHKAGLEQQAAMRLSLDMRAMGSARPPYPARDHAEQERLLRAIPPDPNIRKRIAAFFQRAFNHPDNRCASCHIEHVGADTMQASTPVLSPEALETARPNPIAKIAMQNSCESCHAGLKARLRDTELLDAPNWDKHPDFRPLVTLSPAGPAPRIERLALSSTPLENTGLIFSHRQHLLENGGVARKAQLLGRDKGYGAALDCANCHKPEASGFKPIKMTETCAPCHSLDYAIRDGTLQKLEHGKADRVVEQLRAFYASVNPGSRGSAAAFVWRPGFGISGGRDLQDVPQLPLAVRVENGVRAAFSKGGTCYGCHEIVAPKTPQSLAFDVAPVRLPASYLPRGDFDHSVKQHHEKVDGTPLCDTCHEAAKSERATDLMLPSITKCAACHGKDKAQVAAAAPADCAECHGYHDTAKPVARPLGELQARLH
jgi:hypothetical protein